MGALGAIILTFVIVESLLAGTILTQTVNGPFASGPIAGITLLKNGQPLRNIGITALNYNSGGACSATAIITGTSDGTGTLSYRTGSLWIHCQVLYNFLINQTAYSIMGNNYEITVASL